MRLASFICALMLLSCTIASCSSHTQTQDEKFRTLFEGYQLVSVDEFPSNQRLDASYVPNLPGALPLEGRLHPGRVYVFRKQSKTSEETMALKVFPKRLADIGARVTKAPKSSEDLTRIYFGGPVFAIEFELNAHQGKLFNRPPVYEKTGSYWDVLICAYR